MLPNLVYSQIYLRMLHKHFLIVDPMLRPSYLAFLEIGDPLHGKYNN